VRDFKRARQLFDNIPQSDLTTLTTHALPNVAINIYASLRARGVKPVSSVSLVMPSKLRKFVMMRPSVGYCLMFSWAMH